MKPFDLQCCATLNLSESLIINQVSVNSSLITSSSALFVALEGQKTDGHLYLEEAASYGAKYALIDRKYQGKVPSTMRAIRVANTMESLQQLALAYRKQRSAKLIAIVGSSGKTMTKDLLTEILRQQYRVYATPESFNSRLGVALSLLDIEDEELALIEAGISHCGEMAKLAKMICPDHAILTQVGDKHLATLKDRATILHEMEQMLIYCPANNWTLGPCASAKYDWRKEDAALPYCTKSGPQIEIKLPDGATETLHLAEIPYYLPDLLNITLKAAALLNVETHYLTALLTESLPHPVRTEIWKVPNGPLVINDKYCASPLSLQQSLKTLDLFKGKGKRFFCYASDSTKNNRLAIHRLVTRSGLDDFCYSNETAFIAKLESLATTATAEDTVLIRGDKKIAAETIHQAFSAGTPFNQFIVHLNAIEHNLALLKTIAGAETRMMVMIKALGYGTNDVQMAQFLKKCHIDILGVAYVDEAVKLRKAGVTQDLFVLHTPEFEVAKCAKWNLETGVSTKEQILLLNREASLHHKKIKVHLHIDTGMKRLGCLPEEAVALAQCIADSPYLTFEGIMTHLSSADTPDEDAFTLQQITTFTKITEQVKAKGISVAYQHVSNTSGLLRFTIPGCNMVRVGLGIYGIFPSKATMKIDLKPALSLTSRIVAFNQCAPGESIGYGRSYRETSQERRIAVIPLGYSDGIHRHYKEELTIMIHGERAPIIGNICMDYMMADVSHIASAQIGDHVLFFGRDPRGYYRSAEETALSGQTIPHELIACLGPRIQRVFLMENALHV